MAPFRVRNILPKDTRDQLILTASGGWSQNLCPSPEVSQTFRRLSAHGWAAWASHELPEAVTQPSWTITACE